MFLEKPNVVRAMPAGMPELDRETKIRRQLRDEIAQGRLPILRPERGRELDVDDAQFGRERRERVEEGGQFMAAIVQPALMGDLARQLAGEAIAPNCRFLSKIVCEIDSPAVLKQRALVSTGESRPRFGSLKGQLNQPFLNLL